MKRIFTLTLLTFLFLFSKSQNIKHIAMFEGETLNNTGVYSATENTVYRYSYYFDEWFPLYMNGLPNISGDVNIIDLAVADTGTSYTSGIYIIADTAVFNYNWYTQEWYPLSNEGLIRIGGVAQLSEISVFGKGSSTDQKIFCISDTSVFKYEWFYPKWFALYNTGLSVKTQNIPSSKTSISAYPNPFHDRTKIVLDFKNSYTGDVEIAVYDINGKLVFSEKKKLFNSDKFEYSLNKIFESGTYFCEIKAGKNKAITTLVSN